MDAFQKKIIAAAGILLAVMIIVMVIAVMNRPAPIVVKTEFTPPPFEENAIAGLPENVDEAMIYSKIEMKKDFVIHLCVFPTVDSRGLRLYFTSDECNEFFVRALVLTEDGGQIGETGMLNPGEYVEYISLDTVPKDGEALSVKVLSYEPETYYSMGTAKAKVTVKAAGEQ